MVLYQTTGSAQRRLFLYLCVTITSIHKKPAISIHHCCLKSCRLSQETLHIWNAQNSVGIGFAMYSILYKLISTSYHVIIQKVIWPLGMLQIPFEIWSIQLCKLYVLLWAKQSCDAIYTCRKNTSEHSSECLWLCFTFSTCLLKYWQLCNSLSISSILVGILQESLKSTFLQMCLTHSHPICHHYSPALKLSALELCPDRLLT